MHDAETGEEKNESPRHPKGMAAHAHRSNKGVTQPPVSHVGVWGCAAARLGGEGGGTKDEKPMAHSPDE